VNEVLGPGVRGVDAADQEALDEALTTLDGTPDLGRLGANAVLAVSVAAALAASDATGAPLYATLAPGGEPVLPLPMVNVVSGGRHAGGAVDIQDVLVVPLGAGSFADAIEWAGRVRRATAELAREQGLPAALVADEGGLGLALGSNAAAVEIVARGIERAGLAPGEEAAIAIDVAATQLYRDGRYALETERRLLEASALLDEIERWCERFCVVSVEDPLAEDDWDGWAEATARLGGRLQLVGDDLFVTDAARLRRGIETGVGNAILVKPNQCGTLSAARSVLELGLAAGYAAVVSARSGETEDAWLADLAVGWSAGQIKVGSTTRSERTAKWNRLLRIEAELGRRARFAGRAALAPR
jgi:enolase